MKRFVVFLCSIATFGFFTPFSSFSKIQEYTKMSVKDIMTLNIDSIAAGSLHSPKHGDTVLLTGIVTVAPLINYPTDKRPNMTIGNSWVTYLRDLNTKFTQSSGICVIQTDTTVKTTLFERMKVGDVVEVLVRIGAYPVSNNPEANRQFPAAAAVITDASSIPVKTISTKQTVPPVLPVLITDFYTGGMENGVINFTQGSQYIGMKVELSNVIVIETSPAIIVSDEAGNSIYVSNQSSYYTGQIEEFNFKAPVIGQKLKKLTGYVSGYSFFGASGGGGQTQIYQVFSIAPALPNDIVKDFFPPQVTAVERIGSKLFPTSSDTVKINFDVVEGDNSVERPAGIKLLYTTDGGVTFSEAPFKTSQFGYTGSIPPLPNHSIVGFKVTATDDMNTSISNPILGVNLYKVVDGAAHIADFQTPIYGYNGTLQLSGYSLTLEATVTADNNDLPGSGNGQNPALITMQDSQDPWSGFVVGAQTILTKNPNIHRGDKIRVTGTLQNYFGFLTLSNVDEITVLSSDNITTPAIISTADVGRKFVGDTSVHRWRSMLVEVRNVKIMDSIVPMQPNSGEFSIVDKDKANNPSAFLRVETDASPLYYTTHDSITKISWRIKPQVGREFEYVRGLIFGGNQYYKLIPRATSDFAGLVGVQEIPTNETSLSNYPNPFSTETTIEFSVKQQSPATVRLIDGLGNVVRVLLNEKLEAGTYRTELNASGLSSGVYHLEISTGYGIERKAISVVH